MIEVDGLRFTYVGSSEPALRGISFQIERGEVFGFLGPNGAGKSTTQKVLIGLLRGHEGSVSVLGRDVGSWGAELYERVGVGFELPNHYLKLTALENLAYFRSLYAGATEAPQALLEMVGLGEDGEKRVSQFSKGMRTRLNLARALVHRPELLFLDEPTVGLDPVSARQVEEIIRQKNEGGATIFMTTHDMKVADDLCDRVAFIVDGKLELIDAPRELKLRHGKRMVRVEYRAGASGKGRDPTASSGARARQGEPPGPELHSRDFPLDGLGENAEFLQVLREEAVETIHTQETTLEQIFIDVTGRRLV